MVKGQITLISFYFFPFLFLFLSCNRGLDNDENFVKVLKDVRNSNDSFRIPRVPGGESTGLYEALRHWSSQLNLKPVDTLSTKLEFRAWLNMPGLAMQQRLFILRFNENNFSAELIRFRLNWWENYHKQAFVMKSETKNGTPKSSWNTFSKKFFMTDFNLLFDPNIKDATSGGTDGDTFCFELISNNHYWLSEFDNPFESDDKREIFQLLKKISQLIESEFEFYRMPVTEPLE
jgi:hypothetical protein